MERILTDSIYIDGHFSMVAARAANAHILCKLSFSFNGSFLSRVYVKLITYIAVRISAPFFVFLLPNLSHKPNLSFLVEMKRNETNVSNRENACKNRACKFAKCLPAAATTYYECHKRLDVKVFVLQCGFLLFKFC